MVALQDHGFVELTRDVILCSDLQGRAILDPVGPVNLSTYDVSPKGMEDTSIIFRAEEEKAKELVCDRADVIMISCCFFDPLCTLPGVLKREMLQ